jgi:thiamine biosynthesis lipoprotein apbE
MHSSKLKLVFLTLTALILPAFCFQACDTGSYVREDGMVWNTTYHITFKGDPMLRDSVLVVLNEVGKSLNVFDSSSLVSRVNSADSVKVDSRFIKVYNVSKLVNGASGGMFDPTLSPLITAWGFGPGHKLTADTLAIDSILDFVGINKTRLSGDILIKDDVRTQFNFSAVAKGYGCDEVAAMLRRNGVNDYLVEIGGEIAVAGSNPRGGDWSISIDRPLQTDSTVNHDACGVIEITDAGVATSGNYRNFKKEGGKTFGHTISPVTGRPVATDVISATVIAPTAMEADAAATACMASGSAKSKAMLGQLRFEGMLILSDSTTWMTSGFKKMLKGN